MLLPPAFLLIFFFYPLISLFAVSLTPDGVLDLSGFAEIFTDDYYIRIFLFTTGQAALSTLLTVGLALPGAYAFARFDFPGKALLLSVSTLPFVLPTVVVAAAFSALIGERGILPLNLEGTLTIILIAHVFYNYALALRMISSYWATQSPRIEEAARVLGAHGWRLWWEIRLAAIRPAILASSALIFIFCFTSFGVMLILGGIRFATLEVEIYRQANSLLNLQIAAALSIFQLALMFALMLVYTRLQAQSSTDLQAAQTVARTPKTPREKLFVGGNIALMAVLLFAPLIALLLRSFWSANGWTLQYYAALSTNARGSVLFVPPLEAVGNSVVYALLTTVLSLILGLIAAYGLARRGRLSSLLDPIYMLPLATSAVTLGFGFIIALDEPPLNLRTSRALIVIAHTLVAMPFVVRSVLPALRSISPNVRGAAALLGASPTTILRLIDLPLIGRGLIVGATFAFAVSMGEVDASLFVARPETPTMPLVIFRLLGQPGALNYGQALAMSAILMGVCAISFVLIERAARLMVGIFLGGLPGCCQ
ncbi:MAG: iron ABC transporter permease [Chloroflexi bacterium]|nr:iron ABC transporter permease [Chloroflexota bacterium]